MSNDKFILATNGLYYTANILTTGATLQSSFTNGKLLRRIAGVTGGIAAYRTGTSTTYTDNFTAGLGAQTYFAAGIGADPADEYYGGGSGSYSASGGRTDAGCVVGEIADAPFTDKYSQSVFIDLGSERIVTAVSMYHVQTAAGSTMGANIMFMDSDFNLISYPVNATRTTSTSYRQETWTGSTAGVRYVRYATVVDVAAGDDPTYIDEISVTYAGRELLTSDDYGATVDTVQIGSTSTTTIPAFDTDDYDLGISVATSGVDIRYTTTYTQAAATILDSLTGLNGTALVACIKAPYLKLATQASNNSATAFQFIYGTSAAVSGKTLWGVTFNASTGGSIVESDMTPIISATTYRLISEPNSLSTFGGNTQILAALVTSGGATRLIVSSNGGTSWVDRGALDATSIEFIPPANSGTGAQLFACGSAIGVRYSSNFGVSFTNVSGDLNAETSSTAAIKAMSI